MRILHADNISCSCYSGNHKLIHIGSLQKDLLKVQGTNPGFIPGGAKA